MKFNLLLLTAGFFLFFIFSTADGESVEHFTPFPSEEELQRYPVVEYENDVYHAVWMIQETGWDPLGDLLYSNSTDGRNWSLPVRINDEMGGVSVRWNEEKPTLAVNGDSVYVFWISKATDPYRILVSYSHDAGLTWSGDIIVTDLNDEQTGTFVAATIDGLGTAHLVLQDFTGNQGSRVWQVYSSEDQGASWSENSILNSFDTGNVESPEGGYPCDCCSNSIIGNPEGGLSLVYRNISKYPDTEEDHGWYNYIVIVNWNGEDEPSQSIRVSSDWVTESRVCPESAPVLKRFGNQTLVIWSGDGELMYNLGNETEFGTPVTIAQAGFNPSISNNQILTTTWWNGTGVYYSRGSIDNMNQSALLFYGDYSRFPASAGDIALYQVKIDEVWEIRGSIFISENEDFYGCTDSSAINFNSNANIDDGTCEYESVSPDTATVGSLAPDFTLVDTEGNIFNLSDYRGELVLIEMMATWCGVCKNMADGALMAINNDVNDGDLVGVRVLSIGVDRGESSEDIAGMAVERGYLWQHAIDIDSSQIAEIYDALPVPMVAIVDSDGYLVFLERGSISEYDLRSNINNLQTCGLISSCSEEVEDSSRFSIPSLSTMAILTILFLVARKKF